MTVDVVRSPTELVGADAETLTLTLGNFDGLHLGHAAVLSELRASSELRDGLSLVVTFDPHPATVVSERSLLGLLTPLEEKLDLLADRGVDATLVVEFTPEMADMDAGSFLAWLGVGKGTHMVLGYDFQMGRGRSCDLSELSEIGSRMGYGLDVIPPVEYRGSPISSSRIRRCLSEGETEDAAAMLGRAYELRGPVASGVGLGRELGSPTANLSLPANKLLPADGVYFAVTDAQEAELRNAPGVLYVGRRPTLGAGERTAEVHIFDYQGDLYGLNVSVRVRKMLRGDRTFRNRAALREQIARDIEKGRGLADEQKD